MNPKMTINKLSSIIFVADTEKKLKSILGKDFKYLDVVLKILDKLKENLIDIGLTMNEEEKTLEMAIGKDGTFSSTLDDLFLKNINIDNTIGLKKMVATTSNEVTTIVDSFNEKGFQIVMSKIHNEKKLVICLLENATGKKMALALLVAGVTSVGYLERKKYVYQAEADYRQKH